MAVKRKYVPGRAIQRAQISARDTGLIYPGHLLGIRIGVELALESVIAGVGFDQHCWDTLLETNAILTALDQLYHRRYAKQTLSAEMALRLMLQRHAHTQVWSMLDIDIKVLTEMVTSYHEVITQTTYNQLNAACTLVENRNPKKD